MTIHPPSEALKEALMEHPRHQARHEEEWREAVERIHERLLQESGRRFFGNETLLKTFEKYMVFKKCTKEFKRQLGIDFFLVVVHVG